MAACCRGSSLQPAPCSPEQWDTPSERAPASPLARWQRLPRRSRRSSERRQKSARTRQEHTWLYRIRTPTILHYTRILKDPPLLRADFLTQSIWNFGGQGSNNRRFYSVSNQSSPLTHPQVGTGSWRTCRWRGPPRWFPVWSCTPRRGPSRCSSSTRRRPRGSRSSCWGRGFLEGTTTEDSETTAFKSSHWPVKT